VAIASEDEEREAMMTKPAKTRRMLGVSLINIAALLSGCGSSPPVQLYQLRAEPPAAVPKRAPSAERWVLTTVQLPDYLDRDALVLPSGRAGLQALSGHRWAEPLRDAVPRLLLQDLATLRGVEQLWRSPVPPGVAIDRQLRVELRQFEAVDEQMKRVVLAARWVLADASGKQPARVGETRLEVATVDASPDALAAAHRAALWQLAQAIDGWAATLPASSPGR
jgi:uncharacterized lipoprotein YmbA